MKGIHKIKAGVVQIWRSYGQAHRKILKQTLGGVVIFPEIPRCSLEVGLGFSTKFAAPGPISG